jgi:CO/xanthine dehydrogenase Mo-binding subunit
VPHVRIDFVPLPSPIPIGAWRAVNNGENGFFKEVFVDELAQRARVDPIEYRLSLLADRPRARHVLEVARDASGWARPTPGRGRGVAFYDYGDEADGTQVAMVAEVIASDASVRVERVTCAIDCGQVVSPDTVRAQVEGSVAWAVGATLFGQITVDGGRTVERNFDSYRVLRMAEMPHVDVQIVCSTRSPSGVGEPAVPPTAPAVVNAIYAATGRRVRRLPIGRFLERSSA